jgi:proteasome accessory factor B
MDRTERLLNLVAFFLDAKRPMSLEDVRDAFPDDYSGNLDASTRKFERDKADLSELGIPLIFSQAGEDVAAGYSINRDAYYLPEPHLTPEELAVLYAAGSAALASGAFPGRQDLAHALRKVGFFSDGPLPAARVRLELAQTSQSHELPGRLEQLWGAITLKKVVDLEYFSPHARAVTTRRVDPWGLALRRGVWNLVGHCHLRKQLRTFHVGRIRSLTVNGVRPKQPDFEVPADFHVDAHVASWPWQHRMHDPVRVTVRLEGDLVPLASSLFGQSPAETMGAGVTMLQVDASHLDGLLTYVLSLGSGAQVMGPQSAKARLRQLAQRVVDAHTVAGSVSP